MARMRRPVPPLVTVLVLWAAGLCAAAQFAKVALVLPELGRAYPSADASLGFLVSAISVVGIAFGLVAGLLAVRVGPRRLLVASLAFGAAASLVQAAMPSLPLLLASRVLEGVAHLGIVVAAPTLVAATSTDRWRPAAMTLWGTFFGVSFALTAWLGLPLVEAHGVGALFLAHAACTAAAAILSGAVLGIASEGESAAGSNAGTRDGGPGAFTARELVRRHARAWSSPFVAAPAAGWLFYTVTFVALLAVLPGLMEPGERAFAAAAMPLASIAASMTIGVALLRRTSAVHVLGIGFVAAAALAAALALVPIGPLPAIALFAALGLVQGASFASIPELNPAAADQALANGALAQAGNLGNACGTPLLLALVAAGGAGAMLAAVIACYVAGVAVHVALARRRGRVGLVSSGR